MRCELRVHTAENGGVLQVWGCGLLRVFEREVGSQESFARGCGGELQEKRGGGIVQACLPVDQGAVDIEA